MSHVKCQIGPTQLFFFLIYEKKWQMDGRKTILFPFCNNQNLYFRAPLWTKHQGLKKFKRRGRHLELDQNESIVNQWTLALKGLGLMKSFGRAHLTLRKVTQHMNELKKTANSISRHCQNRMSQITNQSHRDKYRFFNLLTFFKNIGEEQKTDQHRDAKGKKDNVLKQNEQNSSSNIMKLLRAERRKYARFA